ARVTVPESIVSAIALPDEGIWSQFLNPTIIATALAIAFIASAETLLSAAAVDRMHNGVRTDYNKELRAQGVGNLLCGVAGALPMTGVIVRSSANVQAGAMTRLSAILHGIWILGFVALLPWLLQEIPMAALAGILVVTGVRLVSIQHVRHLFHSYGPLPAVVWAATLIMVVATDLLTGVLVGLGLSMVELLPHLRKLGLKVGERQDGEAREITLDGSATFLTLPKLSAKLDAIPATGALKLNIERLSHIDHTCAEMVKEWLQRRRQSGERVELLGATGRLKTFADAA
ncbi:MAG: SulP family inorganic anion transporter, partial [Sphingobium phenoxybenzoativorans]